MHVKGNYTEVNRGEPTQSISIFIVPPCFTATAEVLCVQKAHSAK